MNFKKFFLSLGLTILIVLILFASFALFLSGNGSMKKFLDSSSGTEKNILVAGVDKEGKRADVIMLICSDSKNKALNIVSIPRDTRVQLDNGKHAKINACLGKENGEALLAEKVRELTGKSVHSFCKVNFEGLRNIIDILDGVEYDVPIDMDYEDPAQDLKIHLKKGLQTLDGSQAEGLLRFRAGYANADLGRINVQQDFIKAAAQQKLNFKYAFKLPAVMSEISKNLDTDLSGLDIFSFALKAKGADMNNCTLPGVPKYISGVSYYIADENAAEQIDILFSQPYEESSEVSEKVIE